MLLAGPAPLQAASLVVAAEEAPENFTGSIRAFGPDLAVLVDSARSGRPPGSIFLIDPADIAEEDVSTHRIPLTRLARYIRETMDCRVLLVGIEPGPPHTKRSADLSPAVSLAVRTVSEALRRCLLSI
jgi:hydrogenase maturation protease